MRQCPSVEGSASPLITHRIGVDVCMARQRTFFHKCHRCIYRGKAANWEPEAGEPVGAPVLIDMPLADEAAKAAKAGVPTLEIVVEAPAKPAAAPGKMPAKRSGRAKNAQAAAVGPVAEAGA